MTSNGKIKILYIISSTGFSGAEKLLLDLISKLDKDKFDITTVCILNNKKLEDKFLESGYDIKFIIKGKNLLGFVNKLSKFIKDNEFDIVHTHLFGADVFGGIAAKRAGVKKIISTEHNINISEGKIKHFVKGVILRKYFTNVIAISSSVYEYIKEKYGVKPERIVKISNGVDLSKIYWTNILEGNVIKIGSIGRLTKQKGYDVLIKALPYLNFNFNVVVAGDGEEKNNLINLSNKLKVGDKIDFLGFIDNINSLLTNVDIFVIPSLWEGFGLVAVEALASGKLVIASNIHGLADIIEDGKNGILFNSGDYIDLANKLNYLAKSSRRCKEIADVGYNSSKNFDIDKMVNLYQEVYLK